MKIKFTKFENTKGLLTKTAVIEGGELVRSGATQLSAGKFQTIHIDWKDFGEFLPTLEHNEAIALGINPTLQEGLVTSKRAAGEGVTRTKDVFFWNTKSNLVVLDFDGIDGEVTMQGKLQELQTHCPELKKLDFWLYPSSSSYLEWKGGNSGLRGFHAYSRLPGCTHPDTLKQYLITMLQGSGKEFYTISKGVYPRVLTRYPIDTSVFSPERLLYSSGSHCGEGVSQDRGTPEYAPAPVATEGKPVFAIASEIVEAAQAVANAGKAGFSREAGLKGLRESARAARASSSNPKAAKTQERYFERGEVPGSLEILMDSGDWIPAWKFLVQPEEWNRATCHDPFEPEYDGSAPNKAVVFAGGRSGTEPNSAVIISHAHGTHNYRVVFDQQSILDVVSTMTTDELEDIFGAEWVAQIYTQPSITDTERNELIKPLQLKTGLINLKEVKDRIAAGASDAQKRRVANSLEAFNEKYATVEMGGGGGFRVVREVLDDRGQMVYREQKKQDFLDATAGDKMPVWAGAKVKMVPVSKLWLEWDKRRHYSSTVFDPATLAKEILTPNGEKTLNLFKGFAVEPETGRNCGEVDRGCFDCFFDRLECQTCPHDDDAGFGVTYWLRHIHECVCLKNAKQTRWVVDWLCDIIRNPGGGRPGTALVVHGEEKGTGKGATIWPVMEILGPAALHTSNTDHIVGHFNSQLEQTLLVFADEATWSRGKATASALKYLVTEARINIERKGLDIYSVRNLLRLFVASNNERVVPAEPGERRYSIFEIADHRKGQLKEWFHRFLKPDLLGAYLDEMLNFPPVSDLSTIPDTEALQAQKELATENRADFVFADWALDEKALWTKHGRPREIKNSELIQMAAVCGADKISHEGAKPPTDRALVRRIRKLLKKLGGLTWRTQNERGIVMPNYDVAMDSWEKLYGAQPGGLRSRYEND